MCAHSSPTSCEQQAAAVIEANSADQALDYLVAGGKVDLMFSDIQMPGSLNGLQLAERVRADFPTVPVILTSGNDHLNSETMPGRFIAKPYDITQTVALVFCNFGRRAAGNARVSDTRILIVDSDVLVRTPLAEYLRECGYQVLEATNSVEAKAVLNNTARLIDVVLIDVGAEDQSGFALAHWIRDRAPGPRVILAGTITSSVEKAADLCQDGPAISKPYDHRLVLDRIQRLLAAKNRGDQT
ncbi:Response regulator receiver domain-containing protein [Dyella jiangningensis]|uniref:response regulator n=1 Tax=Dyella sp. AtDHG13 TaxID=1938897 RepID=UPI00088673CB|nr:response regulator [Dyella sp. AtDHG13]PXV53666.1 response regulator receiver domain-containing protein [Dyella sp. AtDHG13]SDL22182.1 Response regulator receiver domain-containing protein [Dyella jiangningensis]